MFTLLVLVHILLFFFKFKESDAKNMLDKIFEKVQRHEMSTVVSFLQSSVFIIFN